MPTLNKTKEETKLIFKWVGISIVIIFIFLSFGKLIAIIKDSLTAKPPPQASFGKLPPIPFPNQLQTNIAYSLDTLSGYLPNFSDRINVHKITNSPSALLALNKTKDKVAKIGFDSKEIQISEDTYQWTDQQTPQRRIIMNIFSTNFTLSSPYLITPLQTFNNSNEQKNASDLAKSFLSDMFSYPEDLDEEKTKTALYSIDNSVLVSTSKISNAKIIGVNFFQKDIDGFPIYYEKGMESTINSLIAKNNDQLKVVEARYYHKNIAKDFSAYAIKSASLAYDELKQGKGYIASNPQNLVEIVIKKIYLGYYIGENQQYFLMPVIIFEGDNDFLAYISAIRDEWINN